MCLHQPDVPIDSGSFVKPAVARGRIHANQQDVSAAGNCKVGYVETEGVVSAAMGANVKAVEDHHRFAVRTIELDGDAFIRVRGWKVEDTAIPADAGCRIGSAQRVESLAG